MHSEMIQGEVRCKEFNYGSNVEIEFKKNEE